MRLLITSDLHYNHARSRASADALIDRINTLGGDALLVVGDTAVFDGTSLEDCLGRFTLTGPKLFVAGNHELWTNGSDSYELYTSHLPKRVSAAGWHWLEGRPVVFGDVAVVGSLGWYDYSFAAESLGISRRFYEHKVSPGAAARDPELAHLLDPGDDVSDDAKAIVARWNDGRFIKLHRSDERFLAERLARLEADLRQVESASRIIAAVHHLPFRELLPPVHSHQWEFAKAYLGSERLGALLLAHDQVRHVYCGHSHYAAEATVGHIHAVSIGSGYRSKMLCQLDL